MSRLSSNPVISAARAKSEARVSKIWKVIAGAILVAGAAATSMEWKGNSQQSDMTAQTIRPSL